MSIEHLLNFPLKASQGVTVQFISAGISDFHSAAHYVWQLPYGRNTDRSDFTLVLPEGRGTCSTKHALLAQLAFDQGVTSIELTLGIYQMNERNTPGVGTVLASYNLPYLPEAHCYLKYRRIRIDLTHPPGCQSEPIDSFLFEEKVTPDQIGDYKTSFHRRFLDQWIPDCDIEGINNLEQVWKIREECIASLSI